MRIACEIVLTDQEQKTLHRWSRGRSTLARVVRRSRMILLTAKGMTNQDIATEVGTSRQSVGLWRSRFAARRVAGIAKDAPRGGRRPTRRDRVARLILERTTQTTPATATHWSTRTLAKAVGASPTMVHRVWKAHGLKPHLTRTFKVSKDPRFVEQRVDLVGLYLNPPEHALVLCVDEKRQIQALDRTQPGLPIKKGRCGTHTHDDQRNGTTTLCAALALAEGRLIGTCIRSGSHCSSSLTSRPRRHSTCT